MVSNRSPRFGYIIGQKKIRKQKVRKLHDVNGLFIYWLKYFKFYNSFRFIEKL